MLGLERNILVDENIKHSKVLGAAKWSSVTELLSKAAKPLTYIVLARILAPEAFGVIATVNMIVSFADMLTDAGFQKYLVQHKFNYVIEKYIYASVAFWTNFAVSIALWAAISLFSEQIAALVGNPGLGNVIVIACAQLPLTSITSIQTGLFTRAFDFKTLFSIRIISIFIPFFVTVTLAFLGLDYWSLVIGSLSGSLSSAVVMLLKSKWRPEFTYSIIVLKKMLSFSIWSLSEAVLSWFTNWVDILIISTVFNEHYLGLYKTSITMVNTLMDLIISSFAPVLFSALSRLQNDEIRFNNAVFKSQRVISIFIFPLGAGIYLYKDLATKLLLGSQWREASNIIGIWALFGSMRAFGHFCNQIYRSKGRFELSALVQASYLVILIPVSVLATRYGFWTLVYVRSFMNIIMVLINLCTIKFKIRISVKKMLINVGPSIISAIIMAMIGLILQQISTSIVWQFISVLLCAASYFAVLSIFPNVRNELVRLFKQTTARKA